MINEQTLQGNWHEIQGKLRSKWGSLTDDDVKEFDGNVEQLIGKIQKKTGATLESIEQFFDQLTTNGASAVSRAGEAVARTPSRRRMPSRKRPIKPRPRCARAMRRSKTWCGNAPPNRWPCALEPASSRVS